MNKKDILEIKRRLKKDQCTITKMCGCYVNGEKKTLLEFRETFLNLPEEDFHKYLEISRKLFSGGVGNNILELNFPLDENYKNEQQSFLMGLKQSGLKNDALLSRLYESIIETYDYTGNFLILVYHDAYDVMTKTSDNLKLDESEEVYEYIMCAICPVSLSKPGLGYFEDDRQIKARVRDWVVEAPTVGFVYPAFIDRSADSNALMYYTKNAKAPHEELMETTLGCIAKRTATIQKETFQSIVEGTVSFDEDVSRRVFTDIQENLNTMLEEHKEIYEDTDVPPIPLSKEKIKKLLEESGVSQEDTAKIEASYEDNFGEDIPLAQSLVDSKLLKANEQKKIEKMLIKEVEKLENKLVEVQKDIIDEPMVSSKNDIDDTLDTDVDDAPISDADVVLHVNPSKLPMIKTEMINGQRCIVVPIDEDEQATINGISDLI